MPSQAGGKAWTKREEPQEFALNVPGEVRPPACPPAHSPWLIGSESPTQQGSKKQKLTLGGPQADRSAQGRREAAGPKKGEDQTGQEAGLGSRTSRAEDPQGTSGCGLGFREKQKGLRIPRGETQRGEGMSFRTEETGRRRNRKMRGFSSV